MEKFTIMQGNNVVVPEVQVASKKIKDIAESVLDLVKDTDGIYSIYPMFSKIATHVIDRGEVKEVDKDVLCKQMLERRHLLTTDLMGIDHVRSKTKTVKLQFGKGTIGDMIEYIDLYSCSEDISVEEIMHHIENYLDVVDVDHVSVYLDNKFKICIKLKITMLGASAIEVTNVPYKYTTYRHVDSCRVTHGSSMLKKYARYSCNNIKGEDK
ncbi:MAG: hypothetical protein ACRC7S_03750 [Cetobacterium sp.]